MKGVILAGGMGTRLYPMTKITNKHLLPIYDKPMIYYPMKILVDAGIKDILVVIGGHYYEGFLRLLGYGKEFGLRSIQYAYQDGEGGIAEALGLAKSFVGEDKVCVVLGDNLIEKDIRWIKTQYETQIMGARIVLTEVIDPSRFGVAEIEGDRVKSVEEKPKSPKSNLAVIGIYFYDKQVWDIIDKLEKGARGELEITDVNNAYIQRGGQLQYSMLKGWWMDAGTIQSLYKASTIIKETSET
jgi:glucose-1-phosphate thymidylyltransferase